MSNSLVGNTHHMHAATCSIHARRPGSYDYNCGNDDGCACTQASEGGVTLSQFSVEINCNTHNTVIWAPQDAADSMPMPKQKLSRGDLNSALSWSYASAEGGGTAIAPSARVGPTLRGIAVAASHNRTDNRTQGTPGMVCCIIMHSLYYDNTAH